MLGAPASRLRRWHGLLLALAAIAVLAGCGSDSGSGRLLSQRQADELRGTLSQVEQDVAASNCTGAQQQAVALQDQIDSIRRLQGSLRRALRASARHLEALVNQKCAAPTTTTTTPETTNTTTTPDQGTSGATGPTGKEKKPKKEKPPKETPPGQGGQNPPGQTGGGGGAGVPGETNPDGGGN
jgi:septal ring factor EnvC (AmiA/AmiB activator)